MKKKKNCKIKIIEFSTWSRLYLNKKKIEIISNMNKKRKNKYKKENYGTYELSERAFFKTHAGESPKVPRKSHRGKNVTISIFNFCH